MELYTTLNQFTSNILSLHLVSLLAQYDLCFVDGDTVDWTFAQLELLDKQGVDLRKEMETRLLHIRNYSRIVFLASHLVFKVSNDLNVICL